MHNEELLVAKCIDAENAIYKKSMTFKRRLDHKVNIFRRFSAWLHEAIRSPSAMTKRNRIKIQIE